MNLYTKEMLCHYKALIDFFAFFFFSFLDLNERDTASDKLMDLGQVYSMNEIELFVADLDKLLCV